MSSNPTALISLFRVGNSIHNLNKRFEDSFGLSIVQWCLMEKLTDMPGTSAQTLARAVGVHPSTLTQTMKRLEKKGFIYQAEDPRDSRKKIISITKKGRNEMLKISPEMHKLSVQLSDVEKDLEKLNSKFQNFFAEKKS